MIANARPGLHTGIFVGTLLLYLETAASGGPLVFERSLVDADAIGPREVGDIDGDGLNDIAAVDYPKLVWYRYPGWEKHLVADLSTFDDCKTYRACNMELADMDNDGDLDIVSAAWDDYRYLHLWRNDTIRQSGTGK